MWSPLAHRYSWGNRTACERHLWCRHQTWRRRKGETADTPTPPALCVLMRRTSNIGKKQKRKDFRWALGRLWQRKNSRMEVVLGDVKPCWEPGPVWPPPGSAGRSSGSPPRTSSLHRTDRRWAVTGRRRAPSKTEKQSACERRKEGRSFLSVYSGDFSY